MDSTVSASGKAKRNVVVWLDFGPYAYINFGIISALSKLEQFNFIGIVTTKSDVDFFQKQGIVSFNKLLYYPDCYIGKPKFDLDKIASFEKQLGTNIWLDVFAERSFYKYWTDFHKFTTDEILPIVGNSISFFLDVVETHKPALVLMQQAGENISNLLLYRVAKRLGIKIIMPNQLYLRNKIVLSDNLVSREISNEFHKLTEVPANSTEVYDAEFIKKQDRSESINLLLQESNFKQGLLQRIKHYASRLSYDREPVYKNAGKTKLKLFKYRLQSRLDAKKRKDFLDSNSIKTIKDEKFLYFPLSTEPEARILATSPFYTNQIVLIENIAKSIPIDYVLYVKEHPVQRLKMWRSIDDYKKILAIPNVRLVHPDVKNTDLLLKSSAVTAISGGTAFEAIFHKKPVILFGDEYYDVLPMVTKVESFEILPQVIKRALLDFKFDDKKLGTFMQAFNKHSLDVPYHSLIVDGDVLSSVQSLGYGSDVTIGRFLAYYEKYQSYFELMAQNMHSKIR